MSQEKMEFKLKKVAGPFEGGVAIFLGNEIKTFVIFIGWTEASVIIKEINKQPTIRPLAHDLIHSIFLGFDIEVKEVIISKIVNKTFCATLVLEQKILDNDGQWTGQYRRVLLDARASDSIILALKTNQPIWVTKEVYENVEDVPDFLKEDATQEEGKVWEGTDLGNLNFSPPNPTNDDAFPSSSENMTDDEDEDDDED